MADQSSKLLINEPALQVLPSLAVVVGLNEAIILQQVQYWMTNGKTGHVKDGRKWIYNSYEEWQQQFPFWSLNTIRRAIDNLEKKGVLMVDAFNQSAFDRTRWYSIDYDKLNSLPLKDGESKSNKRAQSPKLGTSKRPTKTVSKVGNGTAQNGQIEQANLGKSLPETTIPETTSENPIIQHPSPNGSDADAPASKSSDLKTGAEITQNGKVLGRIGEPLPEAAKALIHKPDSVEAFGQALEEPSPPVPPPPSPAKPTSRKSKGSSKPKEPPLDQTELDLEMKLMLFAILRVTGLDYNLVPSVRKSARSFRRNHYAADDVVKAQQLCIQTDWRWKKNPGQRMTLQDLTNYLGMTRVQTNEFKYMPEMELDTLIRRVRATGDFSAIQAPDPVPLLNVGKE